MRKTIESIRITLDLIECAFYWFMARYSNWHMVLYGDSQTVDVFTKNTKRQRKYEALGMRAFRRYADRYSLEPWTLDELMKEDREKLEIIAISFRVKEAHGYATPGKETKREISKLILIKQESEATL